MPLNNASQAINLIQTVAPNVSTVEAARLAPILINQNNQEPWLQGHLGRHCGDHGRPGHDGRAVLHWKPVDRGRGGRRRECLWRSSNAVGSLGRQGAASHPHRRRSASSQQRRDRRNQTEVFRR